MTREEVEKKKEERLIKAVSTQTPDEVRKVCEKLGKVQFTAHALGIACLYRGVDMVKVLVEHGANFRYDNEDTDLNGTRKYFHFRYNTKENPGFDYSLMLCGEYMMWSNPAMKLEGKKIMPVSKRAGVLDYLCKNEEKTGIIPQRLLYFSVMDGNVEFYKVLKSHGVSI